MNNPYLYIKNLSYYIGGFIIPKEFLSGQSLAQIESILGFEKSRLSEGAIFAQLNFNPKVDELEYLGDTRSPEHRFEQNRNKDINRDDLSKAAYNYIQPTTKLIKVIPIKNLNPMIDEDENFPMGHGGMQFKLKIRTPALIVDIIQDYPFGVFN